MPQIIVLKPFKFAHGGTRIEELEPHPEREPRDATQELIDHDGLVDEGYIEILDADGGQDEQDAGTGNQGETPGADAPKAVTTKAAPARKTTKKAG